MSLAILIVSYNTCELLRRCIVSVQASLAGAGIAYEIVVVDNASHDATPGMLRAEFPAVRLIETGANLGFAGGNNAGMRALGCWHARDSNQTNALVPLHPEPPTYVFLLNPDTEIVGDAIPQLVRYLEAHSDVAVVGPQLRYADGTAQPSRRRFPTCGVMFWESTPLETYAPRNQWARRYRLEDVTDTTEQHVDWLVGAALMIRRSAIEWAGPMDEGFAMYSEELEWQQRMGKTNDKTVGRWDAAVSPARIIYLPTAIVIHHEGKSSEQAPARRYVQFQQSRLRYARMFFGPRFALGLWLFLLLAYGGELLIEAAKWLLGHKRELRAERIRVYGHVLRGLGNR